MVTNARVNVVMSDKALVKHLQKELARLESELRNPGSASGTSHLEALLRGKDAQIKKVIKCLQMGTFSPSVSFSLLLNKW